MTSFFERLVDFVGAHPPLAFLAVFLLALSEAVPVIGTVLPGSTLILAISALATTAGIMPWALLVAAVLGAIAGEGFSFWLGHRYQRQILSGWPLNRFPSLIERSAKFIRKYGITSVFLARFTAVVRAFVPLLAGILRMSSRQFYVANILSALVWAPVPAARGGSRCALARSSFVHACRRRSPGQGRRGRHPSRRVSLDQAFLDGGELFAPAEVVLDLSDQGIERPARGGAPVKPFDVEQLGSHRTMRATSANRFELDYVRHSEPLSQAKASRRPGTRRLKNRHTGAGAPVFFCL
jgi:membrane protein DedA with SNARE-associated domain